MIYDIIEYFLIGFFWACVVLGVVMIAGMAVFIVVAIAGMINILVALLTIAIAATLVFIGKLIYDL